MRGCWPVAALFVIGFLGGCSEDPTRPQPEAFSGILSTDAQGKILGGDTTDWQPHYQFTQTDVTPGVSPAYPNPMRGTVTLEFAVSDSDSVWIEAFDRPGAPAIETIFRGRTGARGIYKINWATGLPPGIYRVRFQSIKGLSAYGDVQIIE